MEMKARVSGSPQRPVLLFPPHVLTHDENLDWFLTVEAVHIPFQRVVEPAKHFVFFVSATLGRKAEVSRLTLAETHRVVIPGSDHQTLLALRLESHVIPK